MVDRACLVVSLIAGVFACGPVGAPEPSTTDVTTDASEPQTTMGGDPEPLCVAFGARCEECIGEDGDEHTEGCRAFYTGAEADGDDCRAHLDAYFSCLIELTCSEFVDALPCPELQARLVPRCPSLGG